MATVLKLYQCEWPGNLFLKERGFLKINACISKIPLDLFPQSRNNYWLVLFYKRDYLEADMSTLSEIHHLRLLLQALHFVHFFHKLSECSQSKTLVIFVLWSDVAGTQIRQPYKTPQRWIILNMVLKLLFKWEANMFGLWSTNW